MWRTEQGSEEIAESRVSRRGHRQSGKGSEHARSIRATQFILTRAVCFILLFLSLQEHFSQYLSLERFRNATVQDVMGRPGFGTRNLATSVYKGFSLFYVFEVS